MLERQKNRWYFKPDGIFFMPYYLYGISQVNLGGCQLLNRSIIFWMPYCCTLSINMIVFLGRHGGSWGTGGSYGRVYRRFEVILYPRHVAIERYLYLYWWVWFVYYKILLSFHVALINTRHHSIDDDISYHVMGWVPIARLLPTPYCYY